ncbi:MAG: transposase, partial [Chloroflexi bacterium]|nr:transposase [Chloroflexota bacterium]
MRFARGGASATLFPGRPPQAVTRDLCAPSSPLPLESRISSPCRSPRSTDRVDLSSWPAGSRLIARCTKLKDGDQQSFADHDGYRLAVFLADGHATVPELDLDHRGHARVEDRIRQAKDCRLANLPFRSFAHNQVWLWLVMLAQDLVAWTQALCLADDARAWELKRVRYRQLHQSGRIARHARQTTLRLARDWPWSGQLAAAFARLQA